MGVEDETNQAAGGSGNNSNNNSNNAPSSPEKEGSSSRRSTSQRRAAHAAVEQGLLSKLYSRTSARQRGVGAFHVMPDPEDEAFFRNGQTETADVDIIANHNHNDMETFPSTVDARAKTKRQKSFQDDIPHAEDISGEMPLASTGSPDPIDKNPSVVSCFKKYRHCLYLCVGLLIISGSVAMIVLNSMSNRETRLSNEQTTDTITPTKENDALDTMSDVEEEDPTAYYCDDKTGEFLLDTAEEIDRSERYMDLKVFFELQLYLKEDDVSSDVVFQDPCGPHDLALMWMADVDQLQLVSPTTTTGPSTSDTNHPSTTKETAALLQRFAVVLLSFTTKMQLSKSKLVTKREDVLSKPWLSKNEHECNWHGIKCRNNNFFENVVSFIEIPDARLRGSIPNSITHLIPFLATLDVSFNDLTGTLPRSLYSSKRLLNLNLSMNKFSGRIDLADWQASSIRKLKLADNKFSGTIPESFGSMEYLEELNLYMNWFSGAIPSALFELRSLKTLYLKGNDFTGTLSDFGYTDLETLDLSKNALNGTIPQSLVKLTNLDTLNLEDNRFSGTLPAFLGSLESLSELDLSYNKFNGTIPNEIFSMKNLENLRLQFNGISGTLKTEIGKMKKLISFSMISNSLTGSLPSEIGNMKSLQTLSLISNYLEGNVPRELGSLTTLQIMELDNNYLKGIVPPEVCQLTNDGTLRIFSSDCLREELDCPFKTCCTFCNR